MNLAITTEFFMRALSACLLSTAVLGSMLLASRRFSRNAPCRHLGWTATFLLVLFLPLYQDFFPLPMKYGLHLPTQVAHEARPTATELSSHSIVKVFPAGNAIHGLIPVLTALWLCGAAFVALRWLAAAFQLRRMRKESVRFPQEAFDIPAIRARVGIRRSWRLRVGRRLEAPLTWGLLRPVILLPKESIHWENDRTRAVLLHELAHVKRCDNFFQLVALAVCALHWFNPLVWACARRMRLEAEIACDDWVLCNGVRPSSYATEVLRFAFRLNGRFKPLASLGVSMASPCALEERIASIVAVRQVRSRLHPASLMGTIVLCVTLASGVCLLRPTFAFGERPSASNAAPTDAVETGFGETSISAKAVPRLTSDFEESETASSGRRSPDVLSESELRAVRRQRNLRRDAPSPDVQRPPPRWAEFVDLPGPFERSLGADVAPR